MVLTHIPIYPDIRITLHLPPPPPPPHFDFHYFYPEGNDFTDPANQVITFPAGAQVGGATARQCIFYTIINDGIVEGTEQFSVVATPAANFPQGNTATITIVDNDGMEFNLVLHNILTHSYYLQPCISHSLPHWSQAASCLFVCLFVCLFIV